MTIWIDAQFSPLIARWMQINFAVTGVALRDIGLRNAEDEEIFTEAKKAGVVVMSKDFDFVNLVGRFGSPPQIIWVTCGNTSNDTLKSILLKTLPQAMELLESGEPLVEISGGE